MRWIHRGGLVGLLAAAAGLAAGCCEKEKQQIAYLTDQNLKLQDQNKKLQGDLAGARTRESQLMSELDSKDLQITALQTENQELRRKAPAAPAAPAPAAPGAETTVYTETLASDVMFDAGKAALSAAGRRRLDNLLAMLRGKYAAMDVRVYGYTDSDPIKRTRTLWTDNLDLSANRAMAVTRYLWSKGVPAERIETVAMGATRFVGSNASKTGKAKNRRVEIAVVRK